MSSTDRSDREIIRTEYLRVSRHDEERVGIQVGNPPEGETPTIEDAREVRDALSEYLDDVEDGPDTLSILVEGSTDDVLINGQSKTDPLQAIGAGETVETWFIFIVPPETESLDFGTTQWDKHSFDLTHDGDLEIALEEHKG